MLYSLFSADTFNQKVQDLVGTDGVVTMRFRVQVCGMQVGKRLGAACAVG